MTYLNPINVVSFLLGLFMPFKEATPNIVTTFEPSQTVAMDALLQEQDAKLFFSEMSNPFSSTEDFSEDFSNEDYELMEEYLREIKGLGYAN